MGNEIAEMAAHIDAAMHRLLTAIRKFDLENGWHAQGALSCAHWLAWRIGWDLRTARERLRVARKLAELPAVDEHLRTGAMSYSQARAISRVADGSNEKLWVEYAKRMPASQLDKLCSSFQSVKGYADGASTMTVAAPRSVTRRTIDHGMVKIELVLTNDEAAIVWQLLDAVRNQKSEPRGSQTPAEPPMAHMKTDTAPTPANGHGPAEPRAPFVPPQPLSPAERSARRRLPRNRAQLTRHQPRHRLPRNRAHHSCRLNHFRLPNDRPVARMRSGRLSTIRFAALGRRVRRLK